VSASCQAYVGASFVISVLPEDVTEKPLDVVSVPPTTMLPENVLLPPIVLGSLSDGTVPELRLLALRLVSPEPLPLIVPPIVTLLLNVAAPPTAKVPEMSTSPLKSSKSALTSNSVPDTVRS